jgi:HSP20 family molecular chaperone IbpA
MVEPEKIRARFKDGVLEVEIPTPEVKAPKRIQVDRE